MDPRTPSSIVLVTVVVLAIVSAIASRPTAADLPTLRDNGDASRTVSWALNDGQGLALQDIDLQDGSAELPWLARTIDWTQPGDFAENGTLDENLGFDSAGIFLRADLSNHAAGGDFASGSPWTYADGASGNVTAAWDAASETGRFRHASASTETLWDGLDSTTGWEATASAGSVVGIRQIDTGQQEGTGMLELNFSLGTEPGSYAAARRIAPVDWSSVDRLVLWVLAVDVSPPLTFNVTASVGGSIHGSTPHPLVRGWQEIVVDLEELGPIRENLQDVKFQVNGVDVPTTLVYFDDVRIANLKAFDEAAAVNQTVMKANATSAAMGSATLSFDWVLVNASGVGRVESTVRLGGPSGIFEAPLSPSSLGHWSRFLADVSSGTASAGSYDLSFSVRVVLSNTSASSVDLRVDNVTLSFPNRHNGTYLSRPVSLGMESEFLAVSWTALLPPSTSVRLLIRSGNDSGPEAGEWSPWEERTSPGRTSTSLPPGRYFQLRTELGTTNASTTPILGRFALETRHRSSLGSIESDLFAPPLDVPFLRWRSIRAASNGTPATSIRLFVGNGSYWTAVPADGNLSTFGERTIRWRAELATASGLETPELDRVDLVYEYLGDVTHVRIEPAGTVTVRSGDWVAFSATAYDAGEHPIGGTLFQWVTDDPTGRILNNGSYQAGTPGLRNVTAFAVGTGVYGTVQVNVSAVAVPPSSPGGAAEIPYLPFALLALAIGAVAYVGYEIAARRMFATEDVFLISREGRLILHNTRRLRADRDEDILAGMLTATVAFIRDSFREENGDLRSFRFAGKTILVERGEDIYVAAIYSGRVPTWADRDLRAFVRDIEDRFGLDLAVWSGAAEDLPGLRKLSDRFVSRARYRSWFRSHAG